MVQTRRELIATRAADYQCCIAYANLVGANDGLIFDGGGYVNQNGKWMLEAPRWRPGFAAATVDLDRTPRLRAENTTWRNDAEAYLTAHAPVTTVEVPAAEFSTASGRAGLTYPVPANGSFFLPEATPRPSPREAFFEEILDALALGVGDYFEKNPQFRKLGVALSGGRDSLLTLLIAHRYASRVRPHDPGPLLQAFTMPSRYSSAETRRAAETICRELGVPLQIVSIDEAFERELAATEAMLAPGETVTELTKQNIQARIRGQRMWNWSNSSGGLFLQTGNMSEKAVGYTTVGGDLEGALGVLANVPKTVVMALLDYLREKTGYEGIALVLAKPAGPELAPDQHGEDELMPFPVLDACFHLFGAEKLLPQEVEEALVVDVPRLHARPASRLGGEVRPPLPRLHLQVGAGADLAAHRQPRPRPRARPAAAGRAEPGMGGDRGPGSGDDQTLMSIPKKGAVPAANTPHPQPFSPCVVHGGTRFAVGETPAYFGVAATNVRPPTALAAGLWGRRT